INVCSAIGLVAKGRIDSTSSITWIGPHRDLAATRPSIPSSINNNHNRNHIHNNTFASYTHPSSCVSAEDGVVESPVSFFNGHTKCEPVPLPLGNGTLPPSVVPAVINDYHNANVHAPYIAPQCEQPMYPEFNQDHFPLPEGDMYPESIFSSDYENTQ